MIRKMITVGLCLSLSFGVAACSTQNSNAETPSEETQSSTAGAAENGSENIPESGLPEVLVDETTASAEQGESGTMNITINDNTYTLALESNVTVDELAANMPLELNMVRYAGHEYYAELPFTPVRASETTTEIHAGHVYYWDGWNAFVINYEDMDIRPYQVVHVGEITDADISDYLRSASENLVISIE